MSYDIKSNMSAYLLGFKNPVMQNFLTICGKNMDLPGFPMPVPLQCELYDSDEQRNLAPCCESIFFSTISSVSFCLSSKLLTCTLKEVHDYHYLFLLILGYGQLHEQDNFLVKPQRSLLDFCRLTIFIDINILINLFKETETAPHNRPRGNHNFMICSKMPRYA